MHARTQGPSKQEPKNCFSSASERCGMRHHSQHRLSPAWRPNNFAAADRELLQLLCTA